jgi:hypothetical protein
MSSKVQCVLADALLLCVGRSLPQDMCPFWHAWRAEQAAAAETAGDCCRMCGAYLLYICYRSTPATCVWT